MQLTSLKTKIRAMQNELKRTSKNTNVSWVEHNYGCEEELRVIEQALTPEPVANAGLEELKGRIRYNLNETGCHYLNEGEWPILEAALSQTKKE